MRTAPFLGRGEAFPFRVDPATHGVQVSDGGYDAVSVQLAYFNERWTIRETTYPKMNHIAEAISHILLTRPGEHDTLPEFGSRLFEVIFEPNSMEFRQAAAFWFRHATERWEKRAHVGGIAFAVQGTLVDQGRLPMIANIEFIVKQEEGNLVSPFVTPREARVQEYPSSGFDASGHDSLSQYYGMPVYLDGDIRFNRFRRIPQYPYKVDDDYYRVVPGDTWLLIAHKLFGDPRYWRYIKDMQIQDLAAEGATREVLDPCSDPEAGTMLRVPSFSRLLMEISTGVPTNG